MFPGAFANCTFIVGIWGKCIGDSTIGCKADAVEKGDVEVARLLLSYGADPLLATYAGQTPLQLAEDDGMTLFLKNHLYDVQYSGSDKGHWKFSGPWEIYGEYNFFCACDAGKWFKKIRELSLKILRMEFVNLINETFYM